MDKATAEKHLQLLSNMKPGDSFFLEGVRPGQLGYIRRLGYKLKYKLTIRFVVEDSIYGTSGTRVMRQP